MTDLDKMIERINYIRSQGFITQNEAQDLRQFARSRASAKGAFGPKDRDAINKRINDALNKKGQQAKEDGGLKPPGDTTKPKPGGGTTQKPTTSRKPVVSTTPKPDSGGDKWNDFLKGYNKLSNKQDRDVIRDIFGGNPTDKLAFWKTLSIKQKEALTNSVKDGKITAAEKRLLEDLFKKTPPPTTSKVKPPTTSKGPPPDTTSPPKDDDDDDDDDGVDDDDEEPDTGPGEPTVKGGGKKIDIPKPANRANYSVPDRAERLDMPNIDRKIKREIERVTLQLMSITKEFIEGGMDFYGIDFVAENEILGSDGAPYYQLPDYNSPGEPTAGLAEERAELIKTLIDELLSKGDKDSPNYNYLEYLDLFELRYNGSGNPVFRFSIELTGSEVEDLTVSLAEDYSDIQ